jgi:glycosyltransferase involved in cell wall biosynthesis
MCQNRDVVASEFLTNTTGDRQPLVSVVVPAFNAEATLPETLRSVLDGTYCNIELLVVDDGSTDATADCVEQFARTDPRVRLHRQANRGLSGALNAGFALARGEYVARIDADDLWHPTKLDRQVEAARHAPDAAFIYTYVRYIDDQSRVLRDGPAQQFPARALCRGIYESLVGGGSSAVMKRSAIIETGGCDEGNNGSWEDLMVQLRISARYPVAHVPEYLVGYRVRPGSLSSDPTNMHDQWRLAYKQLQQLFPEVPAWVHAWAHGRRCALFAEGFAWRGRFSKAAALLVEALRHDPAGTSRLLQYRTIRKIKRRGRRSDAEPGVRPAFLVCAPHAQVSPDLQDLAYEARKLRLLEAARARSLEAVDLQLAAAATRRLPAEGDEGSYQAPPARP